VFKPERKLRIFSFPFLCTPTTPTHTPPKKIYIDKHFVPGRKDNIKKTLKLALDSGFHISNGASCSAHINPIYPRRVSQNVSQSNYENFYTLFWFIHLCLCKLVTSTLLDDLVNDFFTFRCNEEIME